MRPFATACLFLLLASACDTPHDPASPDPNEIGEGVRAEDAARLALREAARDDSLTLASPFIDPVVWQSLYDALQAVDGMRHPARDSVVSMYGVRTFPYFSTQELDLYSILGAPSVEQWRNGGQVTGVVAIDSVTSRYELEVVEQRVLSGLGWEGFRLRTTRHLNLFAVGRRLERADGILFAVPSSWGGDGVDIEAERVDGGWELSYRIGWGDCPSGCIEDHYWRFRVLDDGTAEYIGSDGPPPPSPADWPFAAEDS